MYEKTILGAVMFIAGLVSCAILFAGSMGIQWTHNNKWASAWWLLSQYGLTPVLYIFLAITVVGLVLALWGLFEKK